METTEKVEAKQEETNQETMDWESRKSAADKLIYNHTLGAMGIGLIPLPLIDIGALTALQIRLICKLSQLYGQSFSHDKAKNIIGALIGSLTSVSLAVPVGSLIKFIPIVGHTVSVLVMPASGGASTYALGKVFVQHYESGGTFLSFDPAAVKAHFAELLREGRKFTSNLGKSSAKSSAKAG